MISRKNITHLTSRYAWEGLGGRIDNCMLEESQPSELAELEDKHRDVMNVMQREDNEEHFLTYLETQYHSLGHMLVSSACSRHETHGVMAFSEVSARWDFY